MGDEQSVLWLVRHGDREDFVDPDWGATAARPLDAGLSPEGLEQAHAVGVRLEGERIDRIFTSPYLRCAQTAQLIAERIFAPVHIEPGLGELNHPEWSAGVPTLLSMEALTAATGAFASHEAVHEPVYPETIPQAFTRAEKTARAINRRYGGRVLLVAHAVTIIGIVRALADEHADVPCPPASLFRLEHAGGRWCLALSADTSHLAAKRTPAPP